MERVDLRPELIINLVPSQKELADTVLVHSRNTRHALENLGDTDHLEKTAGELQRVRQQVGRAWFHERSKEIDKASSEPAEEEILTLDEAKKCKEDYPHDTAGFFECYIPKFSEIRR
jgi:DNA-binding transcriptional regulator YhcF (GntR family)